MSRKSKKEFDEVEHLQQEIRNLKAENRHLHKHLKKLDKDYAKELAEANHVKALEENYERTTEEKCSHCGKGKIVTIDIAGRKFKRCDSCTWKSGRKVS